MSLNSVTVISALQIIDSNISFVKFHILNLPEGSFSVNIFTSYCHNQIIESFLY